MRHRLLRLFVSLSAALPLSIAVVSPATAQPAPPPPPGFGALESIQIPGQGATGRWDFMVVDPNAHRLYIADSTNSTLDVIDTNTVQVSAQIGGLPVKLDDKGAFANGANGFQVASDLNKGFASDDVDNSLHVYDLNTLTQTAVVPTTQEGSDSVAYDPPDKKVYVSNADSKSIAVFDATSNKLLRTIKLPGSPEIAVYDPADHMLHQNLSDTNQHAIIDPKSDSVKAVWNLPKTCEPHGIGVDPTTNHLIIGCRQQMTVILDGNNGNVLAQTDKVGGSDIADYDPVNKRFYVASANNPGGPVMGVFDAAAPYDLLGTAKTAAGAHSLVVDPSDGIIFVGAGGTGQVMLFPPAPAALYYPTQPGTVTQEPPTVTALPAGHDAAADIMEVDQQHQMLYVGVSDNLARNAGGVAMFDVSSPEAQLVGYVDLGTGSNGVITAPDVQKIAVGLRDSSVAIVDVDPTSSTFMQVLAKIDTGGQARADEGDYDPVDHKLYIANSDDGLVTVVDMVNNTMLTQFQDLGPGLEQPRYNPADGMMYMTGSEENAIYQFDPTTDTMLGKVDVGEACRPNGLAIDPNTNQAVLGCGTRVGEHAALWDFGQQKVVARFDQVGGTDAAIYDGAADVYLTASAGYFRGPSIGVISGTSPRFITRVGPTGPGAHQVAYDEANQMIYTMVPNGSVLGLGGFPLPQ
jgi:YVTN family beta-propeller protein